jgi:formylglycine-generating enzyme required for sulfatase activity
MRTVRHWTGREVRALRAAQRMSIREFAAHLGVSDRMVSKWEAAGEHIHPRPVNQAALDTSLSRSSPDVRARFAQFIATPPLLEDAAEPGSMLIRHPADGKQMALVPGGAFREGLADEASWLPAFYVDVHPTTNAEYGRFVAATGHRPPAHWVDGEWPEGLDNHPVVLVSWHDAQAYASWAGRALPTGEQWEKAARGAHGDSFPWGEQPLPHRCNAWEAGIGATTPVGRYVRGVSPYGAYDLCGNVWEWCATERMPNRFERKGGSFATPLSQCMPALGIDAPAELRTDDTGFRCVMG